MKNKLVIGMLIFFNAILMFGIVDYGIQLENNGSGQPVNKEGHKFDVNGTLTCVCPPPDDYNTNCWCVHYKDNK